MGEWCVCVVWTVNASVWLWCSSQLKRRKMLTETQRSSPWRRMISRLESTGERALSWPLTSDRTKPTDPRRSADEFFSPTSPSSSPPMDLLCCWWSDADPAGLDHVLVSRMIGISELDDPAAYLLYQNIVLHPSLPWSRIILQMLVSYNDARSELKLLVCHLKSIPVLFCTCAGER